MKCAECGGELVPVNTPLTGSVNEEQYTVYGISRLECQECHEYIIEADEEERFSKELWRLYRQQHGILSAQEIADLRSSLHLTQAEFGKMVEANAQTVCRWEKGRVVPDPRANKLMVLLRDCPEARSTMFELAEIHEAPARPVAASVSGYSLARFAHSAERVDRGDFTFGNRAPARMPDGNTRITTSKEVVL